MNKLVKRLIFYALLILAWEFVACLHIWPEYLFPSPIGVLKIFRDSFFEQTFLLNILASFNRLVIGYTISLFFGLFVGLCLYRFKIVDETFGTLILGFQTLPSICWLPLALLWFGLSNTAIIFVVVMGAFFPIAMATESSIKNIDPVYLKSGRNMRAHGLTLLFSVIFPAMLPSFITGLRQG